MSLSHKSSSTQTFRMMLYRRPLHPELFNLELRRTDRHGEYEVETWLIPGGHVVRFQVGGQIFTETVLEAGDHLPETGLVHALPCLGEKDYEMDPEGRVGYVTTIQTEALTENLYDATLREMEDFARETGSLAHVWDGSESTTGGTSGGTSGGGGGRNLSVLDTQKYRREFHFQSYHLIAATGAVLRTQSIFEIVK